MKDSIEDAAELGSIDRSSSVTLSGKGHPSIAGGRITVSTTCVK